MKTKNYLFLLAFAMFILSPFKVNAYELTAYDYEGTEKTIEVESSDTIEAVKTKIGMETGKTADDTILVLDGREMENGRMLSDYTIDPATDALYMLGDTVVTLNAGTGATFEGLPTDQTTYLLPLYVIPYTDFDSFGVKKAGYTFKGWYTDPTDGDYIDYYLNTAPPSSTVFYAQWYTEGTMVIDITKALNTDDLPYNEVVMIEYLDGIGELTIENGTVKNKAGLALFSISDPDGMFVLYDDVTTDNNITYTLEQYEKDALVANGFTDCPDKVEIIVSTIAPGTNPGTTPSGPAVENPNTYDGIGNSLFIGAISLLGLVGATIYLTKKNKVVKSN